MTTTNQLKRKMSLKKKKTRMTMLALQVLVRKNSKLMRLSVFVTNVWTSSLKRTRFRITSFFWRQNACVLRKRNVPSLSSSLKLKSPLLTSRRKKWPSLTNLMCRWCWKSNRFRIWSTMLNVWTTGATSVKTSCRDDSKKWRMNVMTKKRSNKKWKKSNAPLLKRMTGVAFSCLMTCLTQSCLLALSCNHCLSARENSISKQVSCKLSVTKLLPRKSLRKKKIKSRLNVVMKSAVNTRKSNCFASVI